MRNPKRGAAAALVLSLLCGGCGTLINYSSSTPKIYGGPRVFFPSADDVGPGLELFILGFPLILIDSTLSLVFDTLLLPAIIHARHLKEANRKAPGESRPIAPPPAPCRGRDRRGEVHFECPSQALKGDQLCARHRRLADDAPDSKRADVFELIAALRKPDEALHASALEKLTELGPEAFPAIPDILRGIVERADTEASSSLLPRAIRAYASASGEDFSPPAEGYELTAPLGDRAPVLILEGRAATPQIIAEDRLLSLAGAVAGPELDLQPAALAILQDRGLISDSIRRAKTGASKNTLYRLALLGPRGAPAIPAVAAVLRGEESEAKRRWAVRALGFIGRGSAEARAALEGLEPSGSPNFDRAVQRALWRIDSP